MKKNDVTAVISTYNKSGYLDIVLFSIKLYLPSMKIVVIDDGSTDDTLSIIKKHQRFLDLLYLKQTHKGLAAARNFGIKYVDSNYVLYLDDDRFFLNTDLENIKLNKNNIIISLRKEIYCSNFTLKNNLKCKIQSEAKLLEQQALYERYYKKTAPVFNEKYIAIPWVPSTFSCTIVDKETVIKAGGFDEGFKGWGFEDLELAYRIWLMNPSISFSISDNFRSYHIYHTHSKNLIEQRRKNYQYFLNKHNKYSVALYEQFCKNIIDVCTYNQMVISNLKGGGDDEK